MYPGRLWMCSDNRRRGNIYKRRQKTELTHQSHILARVKKEEVVEPLAMVMRLFEMKLKPNQSSEPTRPAVLFLERVLHSQVTGCSGLAAHL